MIEPGKNGLQTGASGGGGDAFRHASVELHVFVVAGDRDVDIGGEGETDNRAMIRGNNAGDGIDAAVEDHATAENRGVGGEGATPDTFGEHHGVAFMRRNSATEEQWDTEGGEVVVGNDAGVETAGPVAIAPVDFTLDINAGDAVEDVRIVEEFVIGEQGRAIAAFPDSDEGFGV